MQSSKLKTIVFAVLGACDVIVRLMTPIGIAILWGWYFNLAPSVDAMILIIGGLATLFRAVKIGWLNE